jgi:hypothetical protein
VYYSSESEEEEAGYTDVDQGSLPLEGLQYLPYVGMRFLDTDDHVVFLVHSICTHPEYDGLMFKYFVVSSSSTAEETPPTDGTADSCLFNSFLLCWMC